jgi:hypothetical protein
MMEGGPFHRRQDMSEAYGEVAMNPRADLDELAELDRQAGDDQFVFTPELKAYLADADWANEQFWTDAWVPYIGRYIAVVEKRLVGHGLDPVALRVRVARDHRVSPDRVYVTYVEDFEC